MVKNVIYNIKMADCRRLGAAVCCFLMVCSFVIMVISFLTDCSCCGCGLQFFSSCSCCDYGEFFADVKLL